MKTNLNKQIDVRRAALIELSIKARAYREEQLRHAETEQQLLYWSSIEKKVEQPYSKHSHSGKKTVTT